MKCANEKMLEIWMYDSIVRIFREEEEQASTTMYVMDAGIEGKTTTRHSETNNRTTTEYATSAIISTAPIVSFRPINGLGCVP